MRLFIKSLAFAAIYFFYRVKRVFSRSLMNEVSVLMYHPIADLDWKYAVKTEMFERQVAYLLRHYHIVPLDHIVEYVEGKRDLQDRSVALTFDDGYADAYTIVFNLAKKYQFPFTVFLTTVLEPMGKLGNLPRLTWPMIIEMTQSGLVTFEIHGHAHLNLKDISERVGEMEREIGVCRNEIEIKTGYVPRYIAYASGHKNRNVIEYVKASGLKAGFSINEGIVQKGSDPYTIKRTQVDRDTSFFLFKVRLTGAIDLHRKLVNAARALLYGKKG